MIKIKRITALLNGADLTPETGLEKAVKTALAAINGKIDGSGTLFVEFTVDTSGDAPVATTEAVFADVAAAVAAGRTVAAKVLLGQGMPVLYFPLSFETPAGSPTALGFSGIMDLSGSGEAAKPILYSITFTANGCILAMVDLAVPDSETETDG